MACGPCSWIPPAMPRISSVSATSSLFESSILKTPAGRFGLAPRPAGCGVAGGFLRLLHVHARPIHGPAVEPQALAVSDFVGDDLFRLVNAVVVGVQQQARVIQLFRDHEPAEAVERQRDIGVGLVGWVHTFDDETRQRAELHASNGLRHHLRLVRGLATGSAGTSAMPAVHVAAIVNAYAAGLSHRDLTRGFAIRCGCGG